jgi:hypothetical protein
MTNPLVRVPRLRLTGNEQLLAYVLQRGVVARRRTRLEEELQPVRLDENLAVHGDPDVSGAIQDVYVVVGVAGVDENSSSSSSHASILFSIY